MLGLWVLISVVGLVFGVRIAVRGGAERALLKRLRQMPTTRISDGVAGRQIKICGRIRALAGTFATPLGEECIGYEAVARAGYDGTGPLLARAQTWSDFLVEDDSGTAVVRIKNARLLLYPTRLRQMAATSDAEVERFISQCSDRPIPNVLLYVESAIRDGAFVQVIGTATEEATGSGAPHGYREAPKRLALVDGGPELEMIVSTYSPHVMRPMVLRNRPMDQGALDALVAD